MSKFFDYGVKEEGWFNIKARDMSIFKPKGKVIRFWLHGDSETHIRELLSKKGFTDIEWIKPPVDELPWV